MPINIIPTFLPFSIYLHFLLLYSPSALSSDSLEPCTFSSHLYPLSNFISRRIPLLHTQLFTYFLIPFLLCWSLFSLFPLFLIFSLLSFLSSSSSPTPHSVLTLSSFHHSSFLIYLLPFLHNIHFLATSYISHAACQIFFLFSSLFSLLRLLLLATTLKFVLGVLWWRVGSKLLGFTDR